MNKDLTPGKQLESLDSIEDALEILGASNLTYMLFVGTHQKGSTVYSNLNRGSALMLDDWNENGTLQDVVREHLEGILSPE